MQFLLFPCNFNSEVLLPHSLFIFWMSVTDISFLISPKSDVFSSGTLFHGICVLLNFDVKNPWGYYLISYGKYFLAMSSFIGSFRYIPSLLLNGTYMSGFWLKTQIFSISSCLQSLVASSLGSGEILDMGPSCRSRPLRKGLWGWHPSHGSWCILHFLIHPNVKSIAIVLLWSELLCHAFPGVS